MNSESPSVGCCVPLLLILASCRTGRDSNKQRLGEGTEALKAQEALKVLDSSTSLRGQESRLDPQALVSRTDAFVGSAVEAVEGL